MSESYHETAEAEPTSRGAGCIFFIADEQTLMFFLRDDKPFIPCPNMIDIIGGHMDPGETPLETTMRELSEELIEAETGAPFQPEGVTHFETYTDERGTEQNIFSCVLPTRPNLTLLEGQRLVFLYQDEARKTKFAFGFNRVVNAFLNSLVDPNSE